MHLLAGSKRFFKLENLFSFEGQVSRAQFWLTLIITSVIGLVPDIIFPISGHKIVLSTFGGTGESAISYPTPIEPITAYSWAMFFAHFFIVIPLAWIVFASLVKRLHDLERSGKWVAFVFGAIAVITILEACLPRLGMPLAIVDALTIVLIIPVCLIGAWGLFEAFFLKGNPVPVLPRGLRD